MSVVIRGMEMPPVGHILIVFPSRRALEVSSDKTQNVYGEAEVVELPAQHGRLIDADELAKEIQTLQKYRFSIEDPEIFVSRKAVMQAISDNPTVIEAEVSE